MHKQTMGLAFALSFALAAVTCGVGGSAHAQRGAKAGADTLNRVYYEHKRHYERNDARVEAATTASKSSESNRCSDVELIRLIHDLLASMQGSVGR